MNQGRIEQLADPEALDRHPATVFAARFAGAGTFLEGRIVAVLDGRAEVDVHRIRFSASDAGGQPGTPAQVLLCPENPTLVADRPGRVAGVVESCAFFGSCYEMRIGTRLGLIRLRDRHTGTPGQSIEVTWHVESGDRVSRPPRGRRAHGRRGHPGMAGAAVA